MRAACLLLLAVLMVTTRSDALLLVTCLMLMEWLLEPRHRSISTLVFVAALATYLVVQKLSGSYADLETLSFLAQRSQDVVPNLVPDLHDYVRMVIHQVLRTLGGDFEYVLMLPAVSLLAIAWCRERRVREAGAEDGFNQQALILSAALAVYIVVRFVLFPVPAPRHLMSAYVLAGNLFARATQPPGVSAVARG